MVGKFCGIFSYPYSTLPQHGSGFGLEVVATWFPVSLLKLEEAEQKLFANYCVHLNCLVDT